MYAISQKNTPEVSIATFTSLSKHCTDTRKRVHNVEVDMIEITVCSSRQFN